jgi:hypothetical protein
MSEFAFFVKTFAITIAIVLVMQIQVGERSLEGHAMTWVQSSAITGPLNGVKRGAAKMAHDLSHRISETIHNNVSKNKKEDSNLTKESPFHWLKTSKAKKTDEE